MFVHRSGSRKCILCVDDDELVLAAIRRAVRSPGYHVITATHPAPALWVAHAEHPDLILLDVRMPYMDGFEFLRRLRADGLEDIPVVMLTADQSVLKGYREGCAWYITKPCKVLHIRSVIEYLIGDLPENEREALEVAL